MCDHTRNPVNGISASKLFALSITNLHDILNFIDAITFIWVVNIPMKDIVNLVSATMDRYALVYAHYICIELSSFLVWISELIQLLPRTERLSLSDSCDPGILVGIKC